MFRKRLLLTIVGPTAIGKTRLAIALAQHFGTEIISCDSRQFFREMRIDAARRPGCPAVAAGRGARTAGR